MKRPSENLLLYIITVLFGLFIISNAYFMTEPGVQEKKEFQENVARKYINVISSHGSQSTRQFDYFYKTDNGIQSALDKTYDVIMNEIEKIVIYKPEILNLERKYKAPKIYMWFTDSSGNIIASKPEEEISLVESFYNRHSEEIQKDGFYENNDEFLYAILGNSESYIKDSDQSSNNWRSLGEFKSIIELRENGRFIYAKQMRNDKDEYVGSFHIKIDDSHNKWTLYVDSANELLKNQERQQRIINLICFVLIWILIPNWVYQDARKRHLKNPLAWAIVAFFSHLFGLLIYILSRPKISLSNACESCNAFVAENAEFCTNCGTKVTKEKRCQSCDSVLHADWLYCATCGTKAD